MNTWTREEILAAVGLAVGLVAALAAIFALKEGRTRNFLIVLLAIIGASFVAFVYNAGWSDNATRLSQRELEEEARRVVARETERRRQAIIEERIRVDAQLQEMEAANQKAEDSLTRREADLEAQRLIDRESAIRRARERYYLAHAPELIVGKWNLDYEYTRDGRIIKRGQIDSRYRFVSPDSIEEDPNDWRRPFGYRILIASPDSFVMRSNNGFPRILILHRRTVE